MDEAAGVARFSTYLLAPRPRPVARDRSCRTSRRTIWRFCRIDVWIRRRVHGKSAEPFTS